MPWGPHRMKASPVTDRVVRAIKEMPNAKTKEIAARAGVRPEYVRIVRQRRGLMKPRKPKKPPRTTPKRKYRRAQDWVKQAVVDGYIAGEKLSALSVEFDIDEATISRLAQKAGLPRRSGPTVQPIVRAEPMTQTSKAEYAKRRADIAARRQAAGRR